MARYARHATEAAGDGTYSSIVNQGYVSDYFLAYRLDAGLADLYARWDVQERNGDQTPRVRVRSVSTAIAKYRTDAAQTAPDPPDADAAGGGSSPAAPVDDAPLDP